MNYSRQLTQITARFWNYWKKSITIIEKADRNHWPILKQLTEVNYHYLAALIEQEQEKPLLKILTWNVTGEWPVITPNWDVYSFDLEIVLGKLLQYKIMALMNVEIVADAKNNTQNIIEVSIAADSLISKVLKNFRHKFESFQELLYIFKVICFFGHIWTRNGATV